MSDQKCFLFLQGPSSSLFTRIADHLASADRICYRINLNVGDQLFWRRKRSFNYRGRLETWAHYIRAFLRDKNIGTMILLGEERPYHREAVRAAKESNVEVVVIEMGYLRPDWVTIERGGMSSNSHFPNDPDMILRSGTSAPEVDWTPKYSQSFVAEALFDLAYYLPTFFLGFLYPHYKFHGVFNPLREYSGWIVRFITKRKREDAARSLTKRLLDSDAKWFVYPLQLETDFQLRAHSPFNNQKEAIAMVIESFARSAGSSSTLVIKSHPLDNGLISWGKFIRLMASRHGIYDRVLYFDGGDLAALMRGSKGLVTVNSTAALSGLNQGLAVKVLGAAIFDIPGLTDQRSVDEFWSTPSAPDPQINNAFFRLLAASLQERGNFYSSQGAEAAASAICKRLVEDAVNIPGGDIGYPPRSRPVKLNAR